MQKEVEEPKEALLDLEKLKKEQLKLAKQLILKDKLPKEINFIAGCDNSYFENKVVSGIAVIDSKLEVVEEKFFLDRVHFPYVPEFLAYRELPSMIQCYNKLETPIDLIFVDGNGILHPRGCGIASHFGLAINKPTIGIAKNLLLGEVKEGKVYVNGKIKGVELVTKEGSRPLYVSPDHMISLDTAVKIVRDCLKPPHKLPEPLDVAHRYAETVKQEFIKKSKPKIE